MGPFCGIPCGPALFVSFCHLFCWDVSELADKIYIGFLYLMRQTENVKRAMFGSHDEHTFSTMEFYHGTEASS